jgi:2'-5' RNA ligase
MKKMIKKRKSARIFIGIPIPTHVRKKICEAIKYYDRYLERVVPEENWHLTLFFLGEVSRYDYYLKRINGDLGCPFLPTVAINYVGRGMRRSQLWAYVENNNVLLNMRREIRSRIIKTRMPVSAKLPNTKELENYNPHVRVGDMLKATQGVGISDQPVAATFVPKVINIYESDLGGEYPVYRLLEKIKIVS